MYISVDCPYPPGCPHSPGRTGIPKSYIINHQTSNCRYRTVIHMYIITLSLVYRHPKIYDHTYLSFLPITPILFTTSTIMTYYPTHTTPNYPYHSCGLCLFVHRVTRACLGRHSVLLVNGAHWFNLDTNGINSLDVRSTFISGQILTRSPWLSLPHQRACW